MKHTEPSWELLRTFLEVLRDGSQSGAARRLGLTQPTVGRHVDALEASLGVTLFTRSQRGLTPTAAALELVPHAQVMASAANALTRAASGGAEAEGGSIRVTASEFMACEVLPDIFASFRRAHSQISIELAVSNQMQDLLRRDADIAVRMARPKQAALVARRIGVAEIGLYAHRDYVDTFGLPTTLEDLRRHRMIGFDRDDLSLRSVGAGKLGIGPDLFCFRTDSDNAQIAALRAGVAIGGCQKRIAERDPNLVPVLPKDLRFSLEVWLAMHEDLRSTRRVRLLLDHLAEGLREYLVGESGRGMRIRKKR